jgi:hypothetical protein
MLSDSQIDRYCRQIVLPEIGSRGQERLLEAVAAIHGGGDGAVVCASYLCGAGVGQLWLGGVGAPGPVGRALARGDDGAGLAEVIRDRNPDCRMLAAPPEHPSLAVWISPALPDCASSRTPIVWGGASAERAACLFLPPGECWECARAVAAAERCEGSSALLGTVLALLALRALLGFEDGGRASVLRLDLARLNATHSPLPPWPRCGACAAAAADFPRP